MNGFVAIFLLPTLLLIVEANVRSQHNAISGSSPWLRNVTNSMQRPGGCRFWPRMCKEREHPPGARMRCCRNQCVDVASDKAHCGLCGIRCPFTWQCCRGFCVNTYISPFNCGRCGNRCSWRVRCFYGLCGYAEPRPPRTPPCRPWPPEPFPLRPHPPRWPHPSHPPEPPLWPRLPEPSPPHWPHPPHPRCPIYPPEHQPPKPPAWGPPLPTSRE